jgi:hypothetical protein
MDSSEDITNHCFQRSSAGIDIADPVGFDCKPIFITKEEYAGALQCHVLRWAYDQFRTAIAEQAQIRIELSDLWNAIT